MIQRGLLILTAFLVVLAIVWNLNPWSQTMFDFHDVTQPARIQQFVQELQAGHIPPRIAQDFSFGMGYPVFTFYAPFTYWVASFFILLGFSVIESVKLVFAAGVIIAFIGMFLFLKRFFDSASSLLGSVVYITIPYVAVEIFVRGNFGELWFLSLLPWIFYLFDRLEQKPDKTTLISTVFVLSFLFTVHNVLSLVALPLLLIYALVLRRKRIYFSVIGVALFLSAYFLVPAVLESGMTYASETAQRTEIQNHFLCISQLWDSPWGFGGSAPGCEQDGLSFKLGKVQIILGMAGLVYFLASLWHFRKKKFGSEVRALLFIGTFSLIATFLTLYQSEPIWNALPFLKVFQFPWRFLVFPIFGLAVFAAYGLDRLPIFYKWIPIIGIAALLAVTNQKYFEKPGMTVQAFEEKYLSQEYIETEVAFRIPEYFPKTGSYDAWFAIFQNQERIAQLQEETAQRVNGFNRSVEQISPYEIKIKQPGTFKINIHDIPNWRITFDNEAIRANQYDDLARPTISISRPGTLRIEYEQSMIQIMATTLTILTAVALLLFALIRAVPHELARWLELSSIQPKKQEKGS